MEETKKLYESSGQGHLFSHWNSLSEDQRSELLQSLSKHDPNELIRRCQKAIKLSEQNSGEVDVIEALPKSSYESIIDSDAKAEQYNKIGMQAIKEGKVGVILMAGGQGTRLGSSAPKGCYDIGLPSHKSLFQIQAERLKRLQILTNTSKPLNWYIMTSKQTRAATESFFEENKFFGLERSQITFFNQGALPALDISGKKLQLGSQTSLVESPDGNGGLYRAIKDNKLLEDFKEKGIEHIHMYCVDNVLVKIADPVFIGFSITKNFSLATKCVRKRDAHEAVGLVVKKNEHPSVIEYSEISKQLAEKLEPSTNLLKLRAANIVNHYYSVAILDEKLDSWIAEIPYHIAKKKIPYYDNISNQFIKPSAPNGIKLEQFIFDVFPTVPLSQFGCLEVERTSEFSPLKNAPGTKNDNPDTAKSAYLQLGTKWLREAGACVKNGVFVEISSSLSYSGENLSQFKGKVFEDSDVILN